MRIGGGSIHLGTKCLGLLKRHYSVKSKVGHSKSDLVLDFFASEDFLPPSKIDNSWGSNAKSGGRAEGASFT